MSTSSPDPNPQIENTRRRFRIPFVRKINWQSLIQYGKNWIKDPMNMALMVWLFFVIVGLVILGLLMLGILNDAIRDKDVRKRWTEIVNQILNALFTIMCLYQHPKILYHLIILCRWTPKDAVELRMAYCKTGAKRHRERGHMGFVIILLHLTCSAQYVLCALYWGWTNETRPDWAVNLCDGLGIAAPIIAGLWTFYSPLGKKITPEYESESTTELELDQESRKRARVRMVVTEPQWLGGLFDCWADIKVAYLSFFCTFCVFGWNMERLGFGNMFVHIATFVLLCIAPLLVFYISALNISDDTLKYMMEIAGYIMCFCGLLYGGFWRIRIRKKFKLPGSPFCCGCPSVTDSLQWLFCWSCSLAQEVRTGNFYEIEGDSFVRRRLEKEAIIAIEPLTREGVVKDEESSSLVSMKSARESSVEFLSISIEKEEMMSAPSQPMIKLDESAKN